jgi:hypothetical protein
LSTVFDVRSSGGDDGLGDVARRKGPTTAAISGASGSGSWMEPNPATSRSALSRAAGCRRLQRRADPTGRLVAGPVPVALEMRDRGTCGGIDGVAQAATCDLEILATDGSGGEAPLGIARVGSDRQQLGDQRCVISRELIDRPRRSSRFAELARCGGRIRVSGPKLANERCPARDKVREGSAVQAGCVHRQAV